MVTLAEDHHDAHSAAQDAVYIAPVARPASTLLQQAVANKTAASVGKTLDPVSKSSSSNNCMRPRQDSHRRSRRVQDAKAQVPKANAWSNRSRTNSTKDSHDTRRYPQPAEEPDDGTAVHIDVYSVVHIDRPKRSLSKSYPLDLEATPLLGSDVVLKPCQQTAKPNVRTEFRRLCELSWPVIVTYVLEYLPGTIGLTLVGHMKTQSTSIYVDAVAMSTMFINLTAVAVGFGLATALDTLCSQAFGAGKPMKMGIYFQTGLFVLGLAMIPVFLLNWYTEQCLLWLDQPPEVAHLAGTFSRLVLPGIPFLYLYELLKKVLQAQNVVTPMVHIAIVSNLVNVAIGVYLTWYTSLGFQGAAIARTIASMALPLGMVPYLGGLHLWSSTEPLQAWWPGWQWRRAVACLSEFLSLGVPGMFMVLLEWWAFEIMQVVVGWLPNGILAISVHSVLATLSTLTYNFFFGISVATNICVGNYMGSHQPEHAKLASMLGIGLSLGVSLVLTVSIFATRQVLPALLLNDPTTIAVAANALLFLLPYQQLDAVNCVMQGVFRGTGRMQLAASINFSGWLAIGLPTGVYLAFEWKLGVPGMWLGLTVGAAVAVVLSIIKLVQTDWQGMADDARLRTS